jgi:hypothetical protein
MSDLNAEIDAFNAANAGSGWRFPRVESGRSFGGAVGFETAGRWNFGVGFDRLEASTKASDAGGALEYRFGANAWRLFGEYPLGPIGRSAVFVGGAVGIVAESGKAVESAPGYAPMEYRMSGGGPLVECHAGGNLWATPHLALTVSVGYRYARVKEFEIEGLTFLMSNGEAMSLDFSGPSARVGIKLASRAADE